MIEDRPAKTSAMLQLFALTFAAALGAILLWAANGAGPTAPSADVSTYVTGASLMIGLLALAAVSVSAQMRLSMQMLLIYMTVFCLLPGYRHMSINEFPFFDLSYPRWVRRETASVIFAFVMLSIISYFVFDRIGGYRAIRTGTSRFQLVRANFRLATMLTFAAILGLLLFVGAVGFSGLFETRAAVGKFSRDPLISGVFIAMPRMITFTSLMFSFVIYRFSERKSLGLIFLLINLVIFLIPNWPLSIARFALFGYIVVFIVLSFDFKKIMPRALLSLGFLFGALGPFPIIDELTRGRAQAASNFSYSYALNRYLTSGDFDGVQSVANVVIYTHEKGIEWGNQLLSVVLFWMPRAIWSGKGEPTGLIAAEHVGYDFINISAPMPAELYVDFGWAGIVIGSIMLGFALNRLDRWIDRDWTFKTSPRLIAAFIVGFSIIVYRGSLLAIISPIALLVLCSFFIIRFGLTPAKPQSRPVRGPRTDYDVRRVQRPMVPNAR